MKDAILKRIGATNSEPTKHSFNISFDLPKIIFPIGTKTKLNFREYVFK